MKREIAVHTFFLVLFFLLITLFKRWFSLSYWPFWLGGLLGLFLPDLDHLIYVYFLMPHELTSQRARFMVEKRDFKDTLSLLFATRRNRTKLIFHTAYFQVIFAVLTFLVVTSSGSLFGRGLVLSFYLHLLTDQFVDLLEVDNINSWFLEMNIVLEKSKAVLYWLAMLLLFIVFAFLM